MAVHPILFRIPVPEMTLPIVGKVAAIPIYSYGVMLGLSLVAGWYLTLGLAKRDGLPRDTMANNYVVTALAAIVMSRVLYVLTNLGEFESFGDVFSFQRGGLVAYGGFLGGFLGSWGYLRYKKIPLLPWADVAVPSLAAGLGITRIGCYLFGCDYGKPLAENAPGWLKRMGSFPQWPEGTMPTGSGSPAWLEHVETRGLSVSASHSLPVHPTQIYASVVGLSLLGVLLWARTRQRFRGQIFFLFTFLYGYARFLLEILRDDPERGALPFGMAQHLFLPLCLAIFGVGWALGISRLVESEPVRRVTQALAFVPPVVAYVMLRPETFAAPTPMQLSTSQFIGLASAVAVSIAWVVYDNAALLHPERAMRIDLPEEEDDDVVDDEASRDSEPPPESRDSEPPPASRDSQPPAQPGDTGSDAGADGDVGDAEERPAPRGRKGKKKRRKKRKA